MIIPYYIYPGLKKPCESHDKVISTVCEVLSLSKDAVLSKKRHAELVFAREIISFILKYGYDYSLVEIGGILSGRDHSTIIHSLRAIKEHARNEPHTYRKLSVCCSKLHHVLYTNLKSIIQPVFNN